MEYIISMAVHCSDVDLIQFQKIYILCLFRQNISLLSPNTSLLWQCNAAMLIQHCFSGVIQGTEEVDLLVFEGICFSADS